MVEEKVEEILKKSITEIDAMAKERGLNPSDYPNIEELAKAIEEKPMEPGEPEKPEGEKPEGEEPEESKEMGRLLRKSREELDTIATEKGLDLREHHSKKEVAEAILKSEKPEEKPE